MILLNEQVAPAVERRAGFCFVGAGMAKFEPVQVAVSCEGKRGHMPVSAPTPCRQPGCSAVVSAPGFCSAHRAQQHRDYGRARPRFDTELGFYSSQQWRTVRAAFLKRYPLCGTCESADRLVAATVVDHVQPIKSGGARFNWTNLQPLCVPCHNRKTRVESRTF